MEIFTLCWISRSTGIILPLLVKGCILSSFIALIDPWKFTVRAEASCRQRERLQRSELVWKQIHWKCQGPKLKGPHVMRWYPAGTWIQRRVCDKWACRQNKKVHQRQASALPERELNHWKTDHPSGKEYSLLFHPLSAPCCSRCGTAWQSRCFPCGFTAGTGKEMRIAYLAQ